MSAPVTQTSRNSVTRNITPQQYSIPIHYRMMENLHIVFWLFKDLAWCLFWKPLGLIMVVPTLTIAIIIGWRTRQIFSELCHNLAIAVWIVANSFWMISEFYGFDEQIAFGTYTYKNLTVIPFIMGILILAYYYLVWKPRNKHEAETL